MRTITVTWDVPVAREDDKVLPKSEIDFTEIFLATVVGTTVGPFASLAKVKPDATQTIDKDMPDGTYRIRAIVTDTFGHPSAVREATVILTSAPPKPVSNLQVAVS